MTLQEYCKYYRTFILKITLKELVKRVKEEMGEDVSISSVSSFENNRSTNIKYVIYYISTEEQIKFFTDNLKQVIQEVGFNG